MYNMVLTKDTFFEIKNKVAGSLKKGEFNKRMCLLFNYLTTYELEDGSVEGFCFAAPPARLELYPKGWVFVKAKKVDGIYKILDVSFYKSRKLEIELSKRAFTEFEKALCKVYKNEADHGLKGLKRGLDKVEFYSTFKGKRRGIRLFKISYEKKGAVFSGGLDEKIRCDWK